MPKKSSIALPTSGTLAGTRPGEATDPIAAWNAKYQPQSHHGASKAEWEVMLTALYRLVTNQGSAIHNEDERARLRHVFFPFLHQFVYHLEDGRVFLTREEQLPPKYSIEET